MTLNRREARAYYDRMGRFQDSQRFYEDPAVEELFEHADLSTAADIFEFGCGTGRLASDLLAHRLSRRAAYTACDISRTMVNLARERLAPYGDRARVIRTGDSLEFPLGDSSVDRVIATYVLDLLPDTDIDAFFREAHRTLRPGGRLCVAGLTPGTTPVSKVVSAVWSALFRLRPTLVGGCRPMQLTWAIDSGLWAIEHRQVVVAYGVPSEVLVARVERAS